MNDTPTPFDPVAALEAQGVAVPEPITAAQLAVVDASSSATLAAQAVRGINPKDLIGNTKIDLSVIPPAAELHLAQAMMDGAAKYGAFNWRENPVLARVYVAAARRHLLQFLDGEDKDPISGVHHLGHAMACCAIILDAHETGNLDDNRPVPGKAGEIIRSYKKD